MKYYSIKVGYNSPLDDKFVAKARQETERRMKQNRPVFFLKGMDDAFIDLTVIVTNPYMAVFDAEEDTAAFLRAVGVEDFDKEVIYWYEIGRELMAHELREAGNRFFIHDPNDIFWGLGIRYELNDKRWREKLIEGSGETADDETSIDENILRIPGNKAFVEELKRISQSDVSEAKIIEHPVHYAIESDSNNDREEVAEILIKSLLDVGRLASTRCMFFNAEAFGGGRGEWEADITELYHEYVGGSVIIDFAREDTVGYLLEEGNELAKVIRKHKDDVLTILLLPENSNEIKELLAPYVKEMRFVPLLATSLNGKDAKAFIEDMCRYNGVTLGERDLDRIKENEMYPASFVKELASAEIKRSTTGGEYAEYEKLVDDAFKKQTDFTKETRPINGELFELIGQEAIMKEVRKIVTRIKVERALEARGLNVDPGPMNFVFAGNPGTAKTTVAYHLAQELYREGILTTDDVIEAGRKDVIGGFLGQTTGNAKRLFSKAHGKVLFIDEAYSLVETYGSGDRGYGKEAIDVFVEELGKPCSDRVVIMAGYPEEMKELVESNPGLKSRMNYYIDFKDYSTDELLDILEYHAGQRKMTLSDGTREWLRPYIEDVREIKGFGNGRFMVNLLEKAIIRQRIRLAEDGIEKLDDMSDEEIMHMREDDFSEVEAMIDEVRLTAEKNKKIGLLQNH